MPKNRNNHPDELSVSSAAASMLKHYIETVAIDLQPGASVQGRLLCASSAALLWKHVRLQPDGCATGRWHFN